VRREAKEEEGNGKWGRGYDELMMTKEEQLKRAGTGRKNDGCVGNYLHGC
jgi:hypothetical protein